ncbi:MAG: hypothetical protein PHY09_12080 [Desulfuromonadaceae bacterium]|nr:hypothetical protein [Desulfuromonadaceae bacterium]MDD5107317.1 hypothetical protein [Desulfuromonadaceae bacterium]
MKCMNFVLICSLCLSGSIVCAAEKNKTLLQLDATRSAVELAAGKIEGNKEAATDLGRARTMLKQAEELSKSGRSMFGFGDISPEAEKEIRISVDAADIALETALAKVEFDRAAVELETIEKQHAAVGAKLKLFEDRKTELEKLRLEVTECKKTGKELESVKTEKAALTIQVEQLAAERGRADRLKMEQLELTRQMDELKAENSRLSALLEKQQAEMNTHPEEAKKKPAKKP